MSSHDQGSSNFEVTITGRQGDLVEAEVTITETIPKGGVTLRVVFDPHRSQVVSVTPWRNLGCFVTEELSRQANS